MAAQPTMVTSASVVSASIAMNSGIRWYQCWQNVEAQ
jgi:hypothetical protein